MSANRLVLATAALLAAALATGLALFALPHITQAGGPDAPAAQETAIPDLSIPNETCLRCHSNPGLSMELENGEEWSLYVPAELFSRSVHGEQGYACVQCHRGVGDYPHPPFTAGSEREAELQLFSLCAYCHPAQFQDYQDSVHTAAQAAGNLDAAVCTDCHTAHLTRRLTEPGPSREHLANTRVWVPQTCANCHFEIYSAYAESVHGEALLEGGDPNVPTCTDCHGVHSIEDPTTSAFRLRSPEICASCHTDPEIMDQYGISTQVLDTYVADFHGTTITLFAKEHPDQEVNKPVCFDCHGVHNIKRTDDPEYGLQIRENLLARCQICHPDATENFPTAWLSHYIPSPERYPIVFWVDIFYKFFIPTVLGGMAVLVVMDAGKHLRRFAGRRKPVEGERAGSTAAPAAPTATDIEDRAAVGNPSTESEVEQSEAEQPATGPLEAEIPVVEEPEVEEEMEEEPGETTGEPGSEDDAEEPKR